MNENDLLIREAREADAAALLNIYAPYVRDTAVSFEYDVPSEAEFRARIQSTLEGFPYFVAERGGRIAGYAYAGPFKTRKAYRYSAETTLYVQKDARRTGVGRALYAALEGALCERGFRNLYACIACPEAEDEFLTRDSLEFHARMGYREVGLLHRCGNKFGHWYDLAVMEKFLGGPEKA